MRKESSNEELHAAALVESEDALLQEVKNLVLLLTEAHKIIENGPLRDEIGRVLQDYG